jgi:hypothetical protein
MLVSIGERISLTARGPSGVDGETRHIYMVPELGDAFPHVALPRAPAARYQEAQSDLDSRAVPGLVHSLLKLRIRGQNRILRPPLARHIPPWPRLTCLPVASGAGQEKSNNEGESYGGDITGLAVRGTA